MNPARFNRFQIRTPEGVTFSLTLAGPVSRCLAWLIDILLVFALGVGLSFILALVGWVSPDLAEAVMVLMWFLLQVGYAMLFEWIWHGQTPGKRWMKLRVIDAEGLRLAAYQVVIRNLLRFVDFLPGLYFLGGVSTLLTSRLQRLGDLAANTVVIRQVRVAAPDWSRTEAGKYNSLMAMPQLVARLRQQMDPEAAYLALRALLRRQELSDEARVAVFAEAAAYFRSLVPFPDELFETVSDEQWVRNVVEAVFRSGDSAGVLARSELQRS
jgi:uncharacterized RDD family membrane protein YckC